MVKPGSRLFVHYAHYTQWYKSPNIWSSRCAMWIWLWTWDRFLYGRASFLFVHYAQKYIYTVVLGVSEVQIFEIQGNVHLTLNLRQILIWSSQGQAALLFVHSFCTLCTKINTYYTVVHRGVKSPNIWPLRCAMCIWL